MGIKAHFQAHGKKWAGAGVGIALAFVSVREGFEPKAVHERADPPGVYTYCFGRTNYDDKTLRPGTKCTREEGMTFLQADLIEKYAPPVQACLPDFNSYPPHRQAALISFAYNLGPGRVCNSNVGKYLRAGNIVTGCNAMLAYDRANGRVLAGLVKRRKAERDMCLRND